MEEIVLLNAALVLVQKLLPIIEDKIKTGEISPDEQQKVRDAYVACRAMGSSMFTGEEWDASVNPIK